MATETKPFTLNISDAPTFTKVLPFIGLATGLAGVYYWKRCWGCAIGGGAILFAVASFPLIYEAHKAAK